METHFQTQMRSLRNPPREEHEKADRGRNQIIKRVQRESEKNFLL